MSDSDKRFFVKYFCIDLKSANIRGKISAGKGLIGNLRRRWRKGLARLLIFLHADLEEFRRNRIAGVGNGWRDLSIFTANFSCRGRQGLARPLVFFTANVRKSRANESRDSSLLEGSAECSRDYENERKCCLRQRLARPLGF